MSTLLCLNGSQVNILSIVMKQSRQDKSIRWELEQLARTQKISPAKRNKPLKKHHGLNLNWKDVVIFSLLMVFTTFYHVNAEAQNLNQPEAVDFDDISSGMMMQFNQQTGEYHSLELLQTEYDVDISGLLATVTLRQTFFNHQYDWIPEAVYAFPMTDKSAVYELKMIVGERVIEGEIHEKQQAQQIYDQAKADGLTATMVKQHRPNIFTSDIANIGPQESISVEITYQMTLKYQQDFYELRLPMAIKDRYVPDSTQADLPVTTSVSDQNYRQIDIKLDAGFDLLNLSSLHHPVDIIRNFDQRVVILKDRQLYDPNDFVLRWYPVLDQTPKAAYFTEQRDGFNYSLLMVMPPNQIKKTSIKRNMTYIMDTSGSMQGKAMQQAIDALLFSLSELDDNHYFNVIDFDSSATSLFRASQPATPHNISLALDFIDGFSANGGTNMSPALQMAMQRENIKPDYLNQIVFMTDGAVGNEATIFDQIAQDIGDARLFTVAIGPAPNSYFMSKAANFGRGTYTHIAELEHVNESMRRLFTQLSQPVLTDIAVNWSTTDVEQSPVVIADLYQDEPLVITARTPINKTFNSPSFVVSGLLGGQDSQKTWSQPIKFNNNHNTTGIARLWARNRVDELTDDLMLGGDRALLKDDIIALGLKHHLITAFTAMVAVDRNPDASRIAKAKAAHQVTFPQGSLGWRWNLLMGLFLMSMAALLKKYVSIDAQ